jgi:hypothetical protein
MEVNWKDPPGGAHIGSNPNMKIRDQRMELLREIAKQPGRWALFATMGTAASANQLATRIRRGYFIPGFEATIHHNEVYVRYTDIKT